MNEQTDIALLFARDPSNHTDEDIDRIIEKYRSARHVFKTGGAKPKATPKLTKKEAEAQSAAKDIDLSDLGL